MALYLGIDRSSVTHIEKGRDLSGSVKRLIAILEDALAAGTVEKLLPGSFPAAAEGASATARPSQCEAPPGGAGGSDAGAPREARTRETTP